MSQVLFIEHIILIGIFFLLNVVNVDSFTDAAISASKHTNGQTTERPLQVCFMQFNINFFLCDKVHVHNSSNKNCAQTLISNLRICYSLNLPLVAVVLSEKSCKIHGKIMLCDFLSLISCCSSKKCVTSALFQEIHRATLMKFELYHSRICYGFVFVQGGGWGGVGFDSLI